MKNAVLRYFVALGCCVFLTGCGGSGVGICMDISGALGLSVDCGGDPPPPDSIANANRAARAGVETAAAAAATATPVSGSVIQTGGGTGGGNIFMSVPSVAEEIFIKSGASGANAFAVSLALTTPGGEGVINTAVPANVINLSLSTARKLYFAELRATVSGGNTVYVDMFSNIESSGSGSTDYTAGGIWFYVPKSGDPINTYQIGAFADGRAALGNLPASDEARYNGHALAYRVRTGNNITKLDNLEVVLNANFGDGTISGNVSGDGLPGRIINLVRTGFGRDDSNAGAYGFFAGDTSATGSYAGKWGGRFYGDGASSAAGTFGASKTGDSIVGVFGAKKEEE